MARAQPAFRFHNFGCQDTNGVVCVGAVPANDLHYALNGAQFEPNANIDNLIFNTRNVRYELACIKNRDKDRPVLNRLTTQGLHFKPEAGASYYVYGDGNFAAMPMFGYCDGQRWNKLTVPNPEPWLRVDVCTTEPRLFRHVSRVDNTVGYRAEDGVPELVGRTIVNVRYSATFPTRLADISSVAPDGALPLDALPGSCYPILSLEHWFDTVAEPCEFRRIGGWRSVLRHVYKSVNPRTVADFVGFVMAPYCYVLAEVDVRTCRVGYMATCAKCTGKSDQEPFDELDHLMRHVTSCYNVNLSAELRIQNCPLPVLAPLFYATLRHTWPPP